MNVLLTAVSFTIKDDYSIVVAPPVEDVTETALKNAIADRYIPDYIGETEDIYVVSYGQFFQIFDSAVAAEDAFALVKAAVAATKEPLMQRLQAYKLLTGDLADIAGPNEYQKLAEKYNLSHQYKPLRS